MRQVTSDQEELPVAPGTPEQNAVLNAYKRRHYAEASRKAFQLVAAFPGHPFGYKALGLLLRQQSRVPQAFRAMEASVRLAPESQEAHANLGNFLGAEEKYLDAAAHLRAAVALAPDAPSSYPNLGIAYGRMNRPWDAIATFQRAIRLTPANHEVRNYTGVAFQEGKKHSEAAAHFRLALVLAPGWGVPYSNYGVVLGEQNKFDEAERVHRLASYLSPESAQILNNLGSVLKNGGHLAGAKSAFLGAILLDPAMPEPYNNLGDTENDLGSSSKARNCFERAITLLPSFVECHANIQAVKTYRADDPHLPLLERLYRDVVSDRERIHLCFALGKAYEDVRNYQRAFALYSEGNRLRKAELGYRIDQESVLLERLKLDFARLDLGEGEALQHPAPILIIGMPRSGTSLVEQILASHSRVHGGGELELLTSLVRDEYLSRKDQDLAKACRNITSRYGAHIARLSGASAFMTDKMPVNFWWIGFLLAIHPRLRVINTIRDPRAVCWSNFKRYYPAKGLGFTCDLTDLADYFALYENLMGFWRQRFPGAIYDLDYERLTEDQEGETRRLLAYCGLEWEAACLEFEKTKRPVRTASAVQVRKKIYRGSSEAWRNFEPYLAPLLGRLADRGA